MLEDLIKSVLIMVIWIVVAMLSIKSNLPYDRKANYQVYMGSYRWREKRKLALERDNYSCCMCGSTKRLQVHHLTYSHFGNERVDELKTLCSNCHQKTHDRSFN